MRCGVAGRYRGLRGNSSIPLRGRGTGRRAPGDLEEGGNLAVTFLGFHASIYGSPRLWRRVFQAGPSLIYLFLTPFGCRVGAFAKPWLARYRHNFGIILERSMDNFKKTNV